MMRKTITRTMATSEIHALKIVRKDGAPALEPLPVLTIAGKASVKEAEKAVRNAYGKECSFTIDKIDVKNDLYEISVDDFMLHATKVERE